VGLFGPRPACILPPVKDGVVKIARIVRLAAMEDSDRLRREQMQHAPCLLGTEQSADPIEKHELGPGEKSANEGEQLLLTRGEARAQVLRAVDVAVRRKQRIEAE
jgi:hypothetical protein